MQENTRNYISKRTVAYTHYNLSFSFSQAAERLQAKGESEVEEKEEDRDGRLTVDWSCQADEIEINGSQ